jgi:hypothetical protein
VVVTEAEKSTTEQLLKEIMCGDLAKTLKIENMRQEKYEMVFIMQLNGFLILYDRFRPWKLRNRPKIGRWWLTIRRRKYTSMPRKRYAIFS